MDQYVEQNIRIIGADLHYGRTTFAEAGGLIVSQSEMFNRMEIADAKSTRPSTRTWKRPAPGKREARKSGTATAPRSNAAVFRSKRCALFVDQLEELAVEYDQLFWVEDVDCIWVRLTSNVLAGLDRSAVFVLRLPLLPGEFVSAWAFWFDALALTWIGPRHTNFPDGSICAFDRRHGVWSIGDSLVALQDLYCQWAFRHLHNEVEGFWPGPQCAYFTLERILEFKPEEHCGCRRPSGTYADCCMSSDKIADVNLAAREFLPLHNWNIRKPPVSIARFALGDLEPLPKLSCLPFQKKLRYRLLTSCASGCFSEC